MGLFVEIVGEKRIADYAKADVRDYKAVLCDLPPNHSKLKETRGLGPRQRAERARKLNIPKMSLVNVNSAPSPLSAYDHFICGHLPLPAITRANAVRVE